VQNRLSDGAGEKMQSLVEQSLVLGPGALALGLGLWSFAIGLRRCVESLVLANDQRLITNDQLLNIRLIRVVIKVEA
jgi:hypothetical protein